MLGGGTASGDLPGPGLATGTARNMDALNSMTSRQMRWSFSRARPATTGLLLSLLQSRCVVVTGFPAKLRFHHDHQHRHHKRNKLNYLQGENSSMEQENQAVDLSGLNSLNKMLSNSWEEFTARKTDCKQNAQQTAEKLRQLDVVVQDTQTKLARATASLLETQGDKAQKERELARTEDEAARGRVECSKKSEELRKELKDAEQEAEMTTEVLKASCPEKLGLPVAKTDSAALQQLHVAVKKCRKTASSTEGSSKRTRKSSLKRRSKSRDHSPDVNGTTSTPERKQKLLLQGNGHEGVVVEKTTAASTTKTFPRRKDVGREKEHFPFKDDIDVVEKLGEGTAENEDIYHPALRPRGKNRRRFSHRKRTSFASLFHRRGRRNRGRSFHLHRSTFPVRHGNSRRALLSSYDDTRFPLRRPHSWFHRGGRNARARGSRRGVRHYRYRPNHNPLVLYNLRSSTRKRSSHHDHLYHHRSFVQVRFGRRHPWFNQNYRFDESARRSSRSDIGNNAAATRAAGENNRHTHPAPLRSLQLIQTTMRTLLQDSPEPLPEACTPNLKPNCGNFEAAMTQLLQSSAMETGAKEEDIAESETECKKNSQLSKQLSQQIRDELSTLNARVASLMAESGQAKNELELILRKKAQLTNEKMSSQDDCERELAESDDAICKLRQARGEMLALKKLEKNLPQDCEVTTWDVSDAVSECQKQCGIGGGTMAGKFFFAQREIITQANEFGMACPKELGKKMACPLTLECPQDCEVSDWSDWSECSAHCGSGVRHRVRSVVKEAKGGGKACPNTSDMENCASKTCNADCQLSDWTSWDTCSQTCGSGLQVRRRDVISAPEGSGQCAAPSSPLRREFKPCIGGGGGKTPAVVVPAATGNAGTTSSMTNSTSTTSGQLVSCANRKCQGKADLVILLDVSAGNSDVPGSVAAVKKFVTGLDLAADKMKVAVVTVKGPTFLEMLAVHAPQQKRALEKLNDTMRIGSAAASSLLQEAEGQQQEELAAPTATTAAPWSADSTAVTAALDKVASSTAVTPSANGGPFDLYRGLSVARELFTSPGARSDATQKILIFSATNFLPNYQKMQMLQGQNFRAHLLSVKIGGMSGLAKRSWVSLSRELNQNFPKATINRTVFQFADLKSFEAKFAEKLLPSMCGVDLK
ncbi:unnamed protein product [Amoebophrya sp. A120]|nr:unnamed protein product [Amoebophrya sp. A120]|eukprot:GSA120T00001070001.1